MPSFGLVLFNRRTSIAQPIIRLKKFGEFPLRALRVLRGDFLPIFTAELSGERGRPQMTFTELNRSLRFLTEALKHGGLFNLVLLHLRVSVREQFFDRALKVAGSVLGFPLSVLFRNSIFQRAFWKSH